MTEYHQQGVTFSQSLKVPKPTNPEQTPSYEGASINESHLKSHHLAGAAHDKTHQSLIHSLSIHWPIVRLIKLMSDTILLLLQAITLLIIPNLRKGWMSRKSKARKNPLKKFIPAGKDRENMKSRAFPIL
jgi:hypothetical protein